MFSPLTRRDFVQKTLQAGALAGIGDFAFLGGLKPVSAQEANVSPTKVQLSPEMEPLVRLIEDTPRENLLEAVAARVRQGLPYGELLAALFLAGVRGIQPRPVGFKFHAVLVVNSAHLASLEAPDRDRWLPLFWALDNFKDSQEQNRKQGNWVMTAVPEGKLPAPAHAKQRFVEAMNDWDEAGADAAIAALVRSAAPGEIIELFWRFGARDFRDIGHKAIFVANGWRTLQTIGWHNAEPVMRSLAYALLQHEGSNPARRDADADRPWRENQKRAGQIRADWQVGKVGPQATADLLASLRTGSPSESCEQVVKLLNEGVAPSSLWDALFLDAGELLMRQPGIVGVHCVTSMNALHYGFQATANDETRRLLLLQATAFLPMFRQAMKGRGQLDDRLRLDTLEKVEPKLQGAQALEEIFADVSTDRMLAARKTLAWAEAHPADAPLLITAARRLVFNKGTNAHDYKFSSAALEDYYHANAAWRARYLATSMFYLRGAQDRDNRLVNRTRAALGA